MRAAFVLLSITIAYNIAEGVVAVWSGLAAGSGALVAFGADSYIEVFAAALLIWHLTITDHERAETAERRAGKIIGWTFAGLAAAVLLEASVNLVNGHGADGSPVGIALAVASVTVMPGLAIWKLRIAALSGIRSLASEAKETVACSYLSLTLLAGLVANFLLGWWWLDAVTALLLVPWLLNEAREGIRGEEEGEESSRLCWCRSCLFGLKSCSADCCVANT